MLGSQMIPGVTSVDGEITTSVDIFSLLPHQVTSGQLVYERVTSSQALHYRLSVITAGKTGSLMGSCLREDRFSFTGKS